MKKNNKNEPLITREGNELVFKNLSSPGVVCNFIEIINGSLEDEAGNIIINLRNKESGVGTRQSGEKIRNELTNVYKQSNKTITLDFKGISIISSSFADELIGKLVTEFGFYGFNNIFKLKNMNSDVQSIVQRSVAQRMIESFNGKKNGIGNGK
jgi:hypothetical protein